MRAVGQQEGQRCVLLGSRRVKGPAVRVGSRQG